MSTDPLATWDDLNRHIVVADEAVCRDLLCREREGRRRKTFILRIHSRLNLVRAERERRELVEGIES
jgi:hypothetical protein